MYYNFLVLISLNGVKSENNFGETTGGERTFEYFGSAYAYVR